MPSLGRAVPGDRATSPDCVCGTAGSAPGDGNFSREGRALPLAPEVGSSEWETPRSPRKPILAQQKIQWHLKLLIAVGTGDLVVGHLRHIDTLIHILKVRQIHGEQVLYHPGVNRA